MDQLQAIQIDVLQLHPRADLVVEQRELVAQLAERALDRHRQPSPKACRVRIAL
jgi:hypothetical protein